MSVLDNIMVGRHHLLGAGFLRGMVYWIGGALLVTAGALGLTLAPGDLSRPRSAR